MSCLWRVRFHHSYCGFTEFQNFGITRDTSKYCHCNGKWNVKICCPRMNSITKSQLVETEIRSLFLQSKRNQQLGRSSPMSLPCLIMKMALTLLCTRCQLAEMVLNISSTSLTTVITLSVLRTRCRCFSKYLANVLVRVR